MKYHTMIADYYFSSQTMFNQNLKLIHEASSSVYIISPNPCKRHIYETIDITSNISSLIPIECESQNFHCLLKRCRICHTVKHVEYHGINCQSVKFRASIHNSQHTVIPIYNMFHHAILIKPEPKRLYIHSGHNEGAYHIAIFAYYKVSCQACSHFINNFCLETLIDYPMSVKYFDYNTQEEVNYTINDDEKIKSNSPSSSLFQICYSIKLIFLSFFAQFASLCPIYSDSYELDNAKFKCEKLTIDFISSNTILNHHLSFIRKSPTPDLIVFKLTNNDCLNEK